MKDQMKISGIITEIIDFNKEVQKQRGSSLKILTSDQANA